MLVAGHEARGYSIKLVGLLQIDKHVAHRILYGSLYIGLQVHDALYLMQVAIGLFRRLTLDCGACIEILGDVENLGEHGCQDNQDETGPGSSYDLLDLYLAHMCYFGRKITTFFGFGKQITYKCA